jgi:hypothetical protein
VRRELAFAIGAAAFAAAQIAWSLVHAHAGWRDPWVLKPVPGIVLCMGLLAVAAAFAAAWRRRPGFFIERVAFVAAGAIAAMIVALMIVGPGNLWPIVIVFDSVIIIAAVTVGAVAAEVVANLRS